MMDDLFSVRNSVLILSVIPRKQIGSWLQELVSGGVAAEWYSSPSLTGLPGDGCGPWDPPFRSLPNRPAARGQRQAKRQLLVSHIGPLSPNQRLCSCVLQLITEKVDFSLVKRLDGAEAVTIFGRYEALLWFILCSLVLPDFIINQKFCYVTM